MKIITVGGMIGCGKTTYITERLKEDKANGIKSKAVYELFEIDKSETSMFVEQTTRDKVMDLFLTIYYENVDNLQSNSELKRTQALIATLGHQVNFLANRATKILDAIVIGEELGLDVLYFDRTIFEDIIFTKSSLFNEPLYWDMYQMCWNSWFNVINKALKGYDVTNIILEASTPTILARIKKRGREMEQSEDLKQYFIHLNEKYTKEMISNLIIKGWDYTIINNED